MVKALTRLLRSAGYRVEGFTTPDEFLRGFQQDIVSCLILDVAMPMVDGLEFHKQLLAMKIEVPVIFLTGHGDMSMCVRAMKNGASDFLGKPVNDTELLSAVRTAFSESARIQAGRQAKTSC